jgi:iron complex outermembrane receptor protein
MIIRNLTAATLAIVLGTHALMSAAQSTPDASSSAAASDALAEVTVTAQRREQNLQQVPISISNFTADQLATQQIVNTEDLDRYVPNMFAANNVGQASANVYYIRGLGQTQSFPTFEPQVGTYVDDIYIARQNANNFALFGVQQVQVLNGPQGTLFGRNSTGGAIVVTLQKPGQHFGGDVEGSYGSIGNTFTSYYTGRRAEVELHP